MSTQPWTNSYPKGVRWDAPIETGPVQSILEQAARTWPQGAALDFMGRKITTPSWTG
jgi:long-chain acyl-CoA synthetase